VEWIELDHTIVNMTVNMFTEQWMSWPTERRDPVLWTQQFCRNFGLLVWGFKFSRG